MNILLIIALIAFCGCSEIKELSYKGGVSEEFRGHETGPIDNRFGVKSGLEAKFNNDFVLGGSYRNRVTDFESNSMEHGFFIDVKIPLWKRGK